MPAWLATGKSPRADRVAGSQPPSVAEGPLAKPTTAPREGGSWQEMGGLLGPVTVPLGSAKVYHDRPPPRAGSAVTASHRGSICGLNDHPEGFKTAATGRGTRGRSLRGP